MLVMVVDTTDVCVVLVNVPVTEDKVAILLEVSVVDTPVTVVLVGTKSSSHHSGGLLLERVNPFEAMNVYPLSLVIRTWSPCWSQQSVSSFPRVAQDPPSVLPSQRPFLLKRWLDRVKLRTSDHAASVP